MGYCITMDISRLTISLENVPKALKAINALHKDQKTVVKNGGGGMSTCGGNTSYSYSWVDQPPSGGFKTLEEAFEAWRYSAVNEDGTCVVEFFTGEKLGNCDVLWKAIAKYVNPKAEIRCRGEDGAQWRWIFKGGKFKEQSGEVIWKD